MRWRIYTDRERTGSVFLLASALAASTWMVWDCSVNRKNLFSIVAAACVLVCSGLIAFRCIAVFMERKGLGYGELQVSESGEQLTCTVMPMRREKARPVRITVHASEGSYIVPPYDNWVTLRDDQGRPWRIRYGDTTGDIRQKILGELKRWKETCG